MKVARFLSPVGSLILIADKGELVYCNWDSSDCARKLEKIHSFISPVFTDIDDITIRETQTQLSEYFSGLRKTFSLPLRLIGTDFQKNVWRNLSHIPFGSTISYKDLSRLSNCEKGVRAVASACGANPLAVIIPCHRIVSANGDPGGYTGGIEKKLKLLSFEINQNYFAQ